jgi:RimJ/RimL family protein N-acetyltransferase
MNSKHSLFVEVCVPKSVPNAGNRVSLQAYDKACLDKSWTWLRDPETSALTMTPAFTLGAQLKFFEQLPLRTGYHIWGVLLDGAELIGAAGLKNHRGSCAEYWGYIGEKHYWGKGLGLGLFEAVEQKAKQLGFSELDLKVSVANLRAISLYKKVGFLIDSHRSTEFCLHMVKQGIDDALS